MRQACRTASDILERVRDLVRPGITTKEVDQAAADFMSDAGVKSAFLGYRLGHRVFPGTICISLNDEVVHGIGSQRRIQYGDVVKLDDIRHGLLLILSTRRHVPEPSVDEFQATIDLRPSRSVLRVEPCRRDHLDGEPNRARQLDRLVPVRSHRHRRIDPDRAVVTRQPRAPESLYARARPLPPVPPPSSLAAAGCTSAWVDDQRSGSLSREYQMGRFGSVSP